LFPGGVPLSEDISHYKVEKGVDHKDLHKKGQEEAGHPIVHVENSEFRIAHHEDMGEEKT
jgi:hypothetical protein